MTMVQEKSFHQRKGFARSVLELGTVFLVSYLLLFAGMARRPGMYDEGIALTAAMRVEAGQVPHRDFYFIYGPAEIYVLAGLFKVFGQSLLVERLLDLTLKALIVTAAYYAASRYSSRWMAAYISIVVGLWLFGLSVFGYATTPISFLNIAGSLTILGIFAGQVSKQKLMAAGAISGAAALFRYDTGIALLGIHTLSMAVAVVLRWQGSGNRLRVFISIFLPYLLGFALVTMPAAIYYGSVAPFSALVHDVILFPAKYYHNARHLPFPGLTLKSLENIGIYLPIAVVVTSVYALIKLRKRANTRIVPWPEWYGFLVTFTCLLAVMYLKGLIRASNLQMYLAIVPSLLVLAMLLQLQAEFSRPLRFFLISLLGLSLLPAAWSALHEVRQDQIWHYSVAQKLLPVFHDAPSVEQASWCALKNPLTRGFCFLPEDNRMQAIRFIASHTTPGQTLYSGLIHHDKVFANDNLVYFATQRMPATHWSHFDPDLQNRYDIQMQMTQELQQSAPPYILLDGEFDLVDEPNDSSKSSGVTLLDNYIREHYQPDQTFGTMSVWKRRG
jgi:hypothetical protein